MAVRLLILGVYLLLLSLSFPSLSNPFISFSFSKKIGTSRYRT